MEEKNLTPAEELKNQIDSSIEAKANEVAEKSAEALEAKATEINGQVEEVKNEINDTLKKMQKSMDDLNAKNESFGILKTKGIDNELKEALASKKEEIASLRKGQSLDLGIKMDYAKKSFSNGQAGRASAIYGDERVSQIQFDPNYSNRLMNHISGGTTNQTGAIRYSEETTDELIASYADGATPSAADAKTVAGAYNKDKTDFFAQANKTVTDVHVPIQTMGVFTPVAEEWLDDTAMLESYLSTRLGGDLGDALDRQILGGTNSGNQLNGINTAGVTVNADSQIGSWANYFTSAQQTAGAGANNYDVLTAMASRLARLDFSADLVILNPDDFYQLSNIKSGDGEYVLSQTQDGDGVPGYFWKGMKVIMSNAQSAGTFTVIDSKKATAYWTREGMSIEVERTGDDFIQNQVTFRASLRGAVTNYRPNGIATGTFSSVIALLNA